MMSGGRRAPGAALAAVLAAALAAALGAADVAGQEPPARAVFPSSGEIASWAASGSDESFEGEALYGHIDGGSEIFLQYGFVRLDVRRYRGGKDGPAREIAFELYRMAGPREAFGIFSVHREGGEKTLAGVAVPHWISAGQASLAAGPFYVNLIGFGTSEADLEAFLRRAAAKIEAVGFGAFPLASRTGPWSRLPAAGRIDGTIRYLTGPLAARQETELLAAPVWGFEAGAEAASAKYGGAGTKLIVINLVRSRPGLAVEIGALFAEFLTGVEVAGDAVVGRDPSGRICLFRYSGKTAAIVLGQGGEAEARALLDAALPTDPKRSDIKIALGTTINVVLSEAKDLPRLQQSTVGPR